MVSHAESRLGMSGKTKLYYSEKSGRILTSAHTPFLNGILLSEKSVQLIKEKSTAGEIVLANELALLKRDHLWLTFFRNVAAIFYAILTEGFILIDFLEPLLPALSQIPLWILAMILCYPPGIMISIWYRRKASAEIEVESIYGLNPQLATFYVFSRKSMSDTGRKHYIENIESNIDSRRSRSIFVSLGITLIVSLSLSAVVYIIFSTILMPLDFSLFAGVLLGGFVFSVGVYHFESKGTGDLKRPDYSMTGWPRATDDLSVKVENLLSIKLGTTECYVLHYPPELLDELDFDDEDFREVQIADKRIWVFREEWDGLGAPEYLASYLAGTYKEKEVEIPLRVYSYLLVASILILVIGVFFLAFGLKAQLLLYIIWIITWAAMAFFLLLAANAESSHRKMRALRSFVKQDEDYIPALRRLAEGNADNEYLWVDAKRKLAKLLAMER